MSATFKIAKKQYTQNDLRRLMQEQRSKNKQSAESQCKVNSPLAKYPFQKRRILKIYIFFCFSIIYSSYFIFLNKKLFIDIRITILVN